MNIKIKGHVIKLNYADISKLKRVKKCLRILAKKSSVVKKKMITFTIQLVEGRIYRLQKVVDTPSKSTLTL